MIGLVSKASLVKIGEYLLYLLESLVTSEILNKIMFLERDGGQ